MKIIEPTVELVDAIHPADIYNKIELCGRVAHQSTPKGNPEKFIRMLIKKGHESVLEHVSLTFHIITDRASQNELVRHRLCSFTVESTRFVKYDELTFIKPPFWEENEPSDSYELLTDDEDATEFVKRPNKFNAWLQTMHGICSVYRFLIDNGATPEQARAILPLCTKSELYMTANLRQWRHFLKLRTDKAAHPQMRLIANMILDIFKAKLPVIVEDFGGETVER